MSKVLSFFLTEKCTQEEDPQWHVDNRRCDVDKPIWEERRNPQKDDVIDEVFSVLIDLRRNEKGGGLLFNSILKGKKSLQLCSSRFCFLACTNV